MAEKKSPSPTVYAEDFKMEVLEYYKTHGPTAASKRFEIPLSTVSNWVKKYKVKTEVKQISRAATETFQQTMAERRARLADSLTEDAERLRDAVWKPHMYHDWGGKDHEFDEREVQSVPPADKLKLIQAASTALDQAKKLSEETDNTKMQAESMLERLAKMVGEPDDS